MTSALSKLSLVAYFDVYGFSALVENTSRQKPSTSAEENEFLEIEIRLQSCVEQIRDAAKAMRLDFFGISDCIFLVCPVEISTFASALQSLETAKAAIIASITIFHDCGLDVRGGISIGNVSMQPGSILIGKPVIRAVRLEQSFDAPLVYLPLKELSALNEYARKAVQVVFTDDPITVKDKKFGQQTAYVFTILDKTAMLRNYKNKYESYLINGPSKVAASYEVAINILEYLISNTKI